jgi:hypothetical protein
VIAAAAVSAARSGRFSLRIRGIADRTSSCDSCPQSAVIRPSFYSFDRRSTDRFAASGALAEGLRTPYSPLGGRGDLLPDGRSAGAEGSIATAGGALSSPVAAAETGDVSRGPRRPVMCEPRQGELPA